MSKYFLAIFFLFQGTSIISNVISCDAESDKPCCEDDCDNEECENKKCDKEEE